MRNDVCGYRPNEPRALPCVDPAGSAPGVTSADANARRAGGEFADRGSVREAFATEDREYVGRSLRCSCDEQPAGRLRIGEDRAFHIADALGEVDIAAVARPVAH